MEPTGADAPAPKEAVKAEAVVKEVMAAKPEEKRKLAVDHRIVLGEVQLMLAEKRTAFALLRTGVSVSLVPLSLWTVLVATSKLWNPFQVLWLLVPLMIVAGGLFLLGIVLVLHALRHLRHVDRVLAGLRTRDTLLEDLLYREPELRHHASRIARAVRIKNLSSLHRIGADRICRLTKRVRVPKLHHAPRAGGKGARRGGAT